ncbi:hypothetical protein ACIRQP_29260 [Streptomyces sp. NPDC102274]|uniref:hypothetical protein n=1 Tax=Streptomyces sp. NPDC102274 TaxID=3366151 RepID=UPI0037FE9790
MVRTRRWGHQDLRDLRLHVRPHDAVFLNAVFLIGAFRKPHEVNRLFGGLPRFLGGIDGFLDHSLAYTLAAQLAAQSVSMA